MLRGAGRGVEVEKGRGGAGERRAGKAGRWWVEVSDDDGRDIWVRREGRKVAVVDVVERLRQGEEGRRIMGGLLMD